MSKFDRFKPAVRIPATVWLLGLVSMLMDLSSEMIHSLLPLFLVTVLGASVSMVGIIEGVAEATASMVKVCSGILSDYTGKRKCWTVLGYGLAALSKPMFALAGGTGWVLSARFVDRVGKGIRGAPRDALIADLTPAALRGAAFGLRQALDTVGAIAGPLLATALMLLWANDFRAVFWVATAPAALAVVLLVAGVHEAHAPPAPPATEKPSWPAARKALAKLGAGYWRLVGTGAALALARFSEAFLVLRAQQGGLALSLVPLALVVMNAAYAAGAYPFGRLADTLRRPTLLALGILPLILADALLAHSAQLAWVGAGLICWGLHLAATQGLLAAMVADAAPPQLRGTAFGFFNFAAGLATLGASAMAGVLWDGWGAAATFYGSALCAGIALLSLPLRRI